MISVRLSCLLLSALPLYSFAIDYSEILQRALTELDDNYRDNWAFTEEREFGGVTTFARFDPRRDKKWQLLSVDGRSPTPEAIAQYIEERSNEDGRGKGKRGKGW